MAFMENKAEIENLGNFWLKILGIVGRSDAELPVLSAVAEGLGDVWERDGNMRRLLSILLALIIGIVTAQAQHFYGFPVQSYRISSVWPTSFRSVKGSVTATIGNSADTRSMRGITATVYRKGKRFASGTCEDVVFYKGIRVYNWLYCRHRPPGWQKGSRCKNGEAVESLFGEVVENKGWCGGIGPCLSAI